MSKATNNPVRVRQKGRSQADDGCNDKLKAHTMYNARLMGKLEQVVD